MILSLRQNARVARIPCPALNLKLPYRRRISGPLATLGVASRFQAGVEAARRGLL
jgi:hypothetical protein